MAEPSSAISSGGGGGEGQVHAGLALPGRRRSGIRVRCGSARRWCPSAVERSSLVTLRSGAGEAGPRNRVRGMVGIYPAAAVVRVTADAGSGRRITGPRSRATPRHRPPCPARSPTRTRPGEPGGPPRVGAQPMALDHGDGGDPDSQRVDDPCAEALAGGTPARHSARLHAMLVAPHPWWSVTPTTKEPVRRARSVAVSRRAGRARSPWATH